MVKKIIYIAAAAGLVFCVIYFGFFKGIFTPSSLSVEDTSISIEEIAEVKEFITAEYYGEVVHSLEEELKKGPTLSVVALTKTIKKAKKQGRLKEEDLNLEDEKILKERLAEIITDKEEKEAFDFLKELFKEIDYDSDGKPYAIVFTDAALIRFLLKDDIEIKREYMAEVDKKRNNMETDIAYLARGWVKAWYDLSKLDEDTYYFCEKTSTLILNLELKIKSEINPWFIFDKKVKIEGFTILKEKNVSMKKIGSYKNILLVKKGCKEKLIEDAKSMGIEKLAKDSAEESLGKFLSLFFYHGKEIKSVKIIGDPQAFKAEKEKCSQENKES